MRCDSARSQAAVVVSTRCLCASTACVLGRDLSLSPLCGVLWRACTRTGLVNAQEASVRPQSFRLPDLTSTRPLLQRSAGAAPTDPLLWLWYCRCMCGARFSVCSRPLAHAHRYSMFWYRSEAVLIYVCLHYLLVFYLIAALAVWLGLASLTFLNYSCGLQTGSDMVQ